KLARALLLRLEQPHVLDRDHGLVGEGLDQLDLLWSERPYCSAVHGKHADGQTLSQQRHHQDCAKAAQSRDFMDGVFRVSKNIVNVNGFALQDCSPDSRPSFRPKGLSAHVFKILNSMTVVRSRIIAPGLSGRAKDLRLIRLA